MRDRRRHEILSDGPTVLTDPRLDRRLAALTRCDAQAVKPVKGLPDTKAKQQAVRDVTARADHGPPVIHAADAKQNVNGATGSAKPLSSNKEAQDAVAQAVKGQQP